MKLEIDNQTEITNKQEGGFSVNKETQKIHKCGTLYGTLFDILVYPLKLLKTILKNTPIPTVKNGVPTTVSIYQLIVDIANENRDYVLLFKIFSLIISALITYYIYLKLFDTSLGLDLGRINMFLKTMNLDDVPMLENVNANMEAEALGCWQNYFSTAPYSFENAGFYDLLRGAVLFPFLFVFFAVILPIFLVIYVFWFIYNYFCLIINALKGLFIAIFEYLINQVLCRLEIPLIGSIVDCDEFGEKFSEWKREYIDEPVYRESLQYFKKFYESKYKYYDKPVSYIGKLWRKGRIESDYNQKLINRTKYVFYDGILSLNNTIQKNIPASATINKIAPFVTGTNEPGVETPVDMKTKIKEIGCKVISNNKSRNYYLLVKLLIPFIILCLLTGFFGYYIITGKPEAIYEWWGPLWREITTKNGLKILSNNYNWLALLSIPMIYFILMYKISTAI